MEDRSLLGLDANIRRLGLVMASMPFSFPLHLPVSHLPGHHELSSPAPLHSGHDILLTVGPASMNPDNRSWNQIPRAKLTVFPFQAVVLGILSQQHTAN